MTLAERTALRSLGAVLLAQVDEITDAAIAQLRVVAPEFVSSEDPAYIETLREGSRGALGGLWAAISRGDDVPHRVPPREAALIAREAELIARLGISLKTVELAYREYHRFVWEYAVQAAEVEIVDPVVRAAALAEVSTFLFAWVEHTLPEMAAARERERHDQWVDRERRKSALIQEIVAGRTTPPEQIDGYPLAARHVCVIAWGDDPQRALAALGTVRRSRLLEMVGFGEDLRIWLAVDGEQDAARLATIVPGLGTRIALGQVEEGPEGFRRTALQAQAAYEVGAIEGQPVTRYDDVALVALALRDSRHAMEFVVNELGPLIGDDPRSALLRETLRTYFACGGNAAAAGARLGVHDRTVAYRLQVVAENLLQGRSISTRRDELDLALRLHRLLRRGEGGGPGPEPMAPAEPHAVPE